MMSYATIVSVWAWLGGAGVSSSVYAPIGAPGLEPHPTHHSATANAVFITRTLARSQMRDRCSKKLQGARKIRAEWRYPGMTALAELAAFATLDAKPIDRLRAQHLVETFAAHAMPDAPVELVLVLDAEGADLVWRDPGAETFHAAAEVHRAECEEESVVAAGVSQGP